MGSEEGALGLRHGEQRLGGAPRKREWQGEARGWFVGGVGGWKSALETQASVFWESGSQGRFS